LHQKVKTAQFFEKRHVRYIRLNAPFSEKQQDESICGNSKKHKRNALILIRAKPLYNWKQFKTAVACGLRVSGKF